MKGYRVYCVGEGSVDLVDALTELGYVPAQPEQSDDTTLAQLRGQIAAWEALHEQMLDKNGELIRRLIATEQERDRLIVQTEQPAAVDWSKAPKWAQWHAFDLTGFGYWYSHKPIHAAAEWSINNENDFGALAQPAGLYADLATAWRDSLTQRPQPAANAADTAALQARVAELEAANADTSHTLRLALTQLDWARWTRDEYANKLDKHRAELRELRTELDAARTSVQQIDAAKQRDELRDRAHAAEGMIGALGRDLEAAHVQIAELTAERDDLAAKWAAVPWAEFEALMCGPNCPLNAYVRNWYNANSPYRQAQK